MTDMEKKHRTQDEMTEILGAAPAYSSTSAVLSPSPENTNSGHETNPPTFQEGSNLDQISSANIEEHLISNASEDLGNIPMYPSLTPEVSFTPLQNADTSQNEINPTAPQLEPPGVYQGIARYNYKKLDRSQVEKSLPRALLKLACPGPFCGVDTIEDWICSQCSVRIEYGFDDQCFYCDCGRGFFNDYDFLCTRQLHGPKFYRFNKTKLLESLDDLEPLRVLNILVLGETGVGKSTFINAFLNYVTFNELDEAINDECLHCKVPCSFSIQHIEDGRFIQDTIKVGNDPNEHDGHGGQAATQKTKIYPFTIEDTIIHLIDTPGIGDTRGTEKDSENMADIIATLKKFQYLHGILILVKSNSARLTVMFRFCVQELLSHLHKDAARNMVFGFTNTRISNYMPGDTFQPLMNELRKHRSVGLELMTDTAYCFDSESFRFLAAHKNGVYMENIEDFRRSWKRSAVEANRLVEHFKSCKPHVVKSTLSLFRAQQLITHLTKPMADISYRIQITISKNNDTIKELQDTELVGKDLMKRLHFQKLVLKYKALSMPQTVCTHHSCVDYKVTEHHQAKIIYKTVCHNPCYLKNIPLDKAGTQGLTGCAAFHGTAKCSHCCHGWGQHQHVMYEYEEENQTVKDDAVENLLRENADDCTVKRKAIANIQAEIKSCEDAETQIQEAAAQFCIFLKTNSITPYNDAMLSYLDHLIREEKDKVEIAYSGRDRLVGLEKRRAEYAQRIGILTRSINSPLSRHQSENEEGVDRLVKSLYDLKHWGGNLQDILRVVDATEGQIQPRRFSSPSRRSRYSSGRENLNQSQSVPPLYAETFHVGQQCVNQHRTQLMGTQLPSQQSSYTSAFGSPQNPEGQVPGSEQTSASSTNDGRVLGTFQYPKKNSAGSEGTWLNMLRGLWRKSTLIE